MTTIYDVAKAAGVTAATVSHVLSGKKPVSDATRKKVMRFVEELGYRPNLVARSLITHRTRTIGFVVPMITNPFYSEIIEDAERITHRVGFRLLVTITQDDKLLGQEMLVDLYARRVDGIILMGGSGELPFALIETLISEGLPIIGCIWDEEERTFPTTIGFDYFAGGRLVAEHLLALGHQRIGIIAHGIVGTRLQHHLRVSGLVETLAAAGHSFDPALLFYGDSSAQSGEVAALQLLALPDPPTAIFATNDLMAIGILSAAWKRGLHVPHDLSVVGFDDIVLASYMTPPLTTVLMDRIALMEKSMEILFDMIEGKPVTSPPFLAPTLVVRASTGQNSREGYLPYPSTPRELV
jgi:DNA-binding LacI/PurR family transcriptional regulator